MSTTGKLIQGRSFCFLHNPQMCFYSLKGEKQQLVFVFLGPVSLFTFILCISVYVPYAPPHTHTHTCVTVPFRLTLRLCLSSFAEDVSTSCSVLSSSPVLLGKYKAGFSCYMSERTTSNSVCGCRSVVTVPHHVIFISGLK